MVKGTLVGNVGKDDQGFIYLFRDEKMFIVADNDHYNWSYVKVGDTFYGSDKEFSMSHYAEAMDKTNPGSVAIYDDDEQVLINAGCVDVF